MEIVKVRYQGGKMEDKKTVKCLECGEEINIDSYCEIEDIITCENCYSDFEIISIDPIKIKGLNYEHIEEKLENDYEDEDWN